MAGADRSAAHRASPRAVAARRRSSRAWLLRDRETLGERSADVLHLPRQELVLGVVNELVQRSRGVLGNGARGLLAARDGTDPEGLVLVVVLGGAGEVAVAPAHVVPALASLLAGVVPGLGLAVGRDPGLAVTVLRQDDSADVPADLAVIDHIGHLQIECALRAERQQTAGVQLQARRLEAQPLLHVVLQRDVIEERRAQIAP